MKRNTEQGSPSAYAGTKRGFGGGRYAAPYSGSYGGEFRTDYRGIRGDDSGRFPPRTNPEAKIDDPNASTRKPQDDESADQPAPPGG